MRNNTPYNPLKDSVFMQKLHEAAEIIDRWAPKQRKAYLKHLFPPEQANIYRTIIRIILSDSTLRKNFIKIVRKGEICTDE